MGGPLVKVPVPRCASIPCRREFCMSHKRFLVALSSEERTYLKQLVAAGLSQRESVVNHHKVDSFDTAVYSL